MLDLIFSELTDKGVNVSCLFTDLNEMFKDKVMLYETTSSKNRHLIIDLPCSSKIKRELFSKLQTSFGINNPAIEDLSLITYAEFKSIRRLGDTSRRDVLKLMREYNVTFKNSNNFN